MFRAGCFKTIGLLRIGTERYLQSGTSGIFVCPIGSFNPAEGEFLAALPAGWKPPSALRFPRLSAWACVGVPLADSCRAKSRVAQKRSSFAGVDELAACTSINNEWRADLLTCWGTRGDNTSNRQSPGDCTVCAAGRDSKGFRTGMKISPGFLVNLRGKIACRS